MPARGLLGHGLEPGGRAPAPGGGGRAPAGPWEAGARGQGPQVLLTDALKILQRVWAASGGVVAVSTSRSPCRCCQACWRGPVSSTASPATNPAVRAGPGGHERGDHRPLSRPGRGPRRARPVHDEGRSRLARLHQDPQGRRARWRPSPGSSRPVTVAHCGPVLKGEFARTVNMTDVLTGWTFTRSIRNNAEKHIISALDAAVDAIPFPVLGMDFDNGSEFINHGVVRWAGNLDIYFTRSRPYRKNDQATIESKNNHVVRRYAFYYRHGRRRRAPGAGPPVGAGPTPESTTPAPTRKPIGWGADGAGGRKRPQAGPAHPGRPPRSRGQPQGSRQRWKERTQQAARDHNVYSYTPISRWRDALTEGGGAMKAMTYDEAHDHYAEVLDSVVDDYEEVVIVRAGREPAVIVPLAEYQSLKETDHLLRNPANAWRLINAIARSKAGLDTYHDLIEDD